MEKEKDGEKNGIESFWQWKRRRRAAAKEVRQGYSRGKAAEYCHLALLLLLTLYALTGCGKEESERMEVEFSVVTAEELPEELSRIIEENKESEMRLTWTDGEALYLIRGYGKQATGGYSVAVAECSENEESIWFDTRLIGPQDQENLSQEPSCPYLVVKVALTEKEVVIEP